MFKNLNPPALGVSGHQSEIIELALTYGFRGMDINIVTIAQRAQTRGMPYARRLIDSVRNRMGFAMGCFELPLSWDGEDEAFKNELAVLSEYAGVAGELGCTRCVATIDPAGDERPYHENFEFHRHRLAEIAKTLEPAGVRLGLGFRAAQELRKSQAFQFVHDFDALSLLVKMVGASNVGIVLDVWDLHVSGGSLETVRGLAADQIVAVQLADAPADAATPITELSEASRGLPMVEGGLDLPAHLRVLAELGYEGPVSLTPSRAFFSGKRRDPIMREVGDAFDKAWKAAELTPEGKLAAPVAPEAPAEPAAN